MGKITPFFMFDNNLGEALELYKSSFRDAEILDENRANGSVMSATFSIYGQEFLSFNGGPHFKFTPSISLFVNCKKNEDLEFLWNELKRDGSVLMELGSYPFSGKFGWLQDRFGVSWQLNLSEQEEKIYPFLMFSGENFGKAEEAIRFYTSEFPNSKIDRIEKIGAEGPGTEGTIKRAKFSLSGQDFMAIDSGIPHQFNFSQAISFFVKCETQSEIDEYWERLSEGGEKQRCGWVKDRFGVSWQIIPPILGELLHDTDREKSDRVLGAMLQMGKIEIDGLKKAYTAKS